MADLRLFTAIKPTTLSSGTAIGATSITPAFIKDREDNSIATMATYFGTKAYGVIGPNTSREEHFSFTGISAGVLTGVSHVSMVAPYTETSGLSEAHAAGEVVIIQTNSPAFYNELANKQNDETVAGTWTFTETAMPRISASHTYGAGEEEYFASKRYVDSVVTGGAADANTTTKGLAEEATQAEIAAGTAAGGTSARLFTNPSTLAPHIQSGAWLFGSTAGTADAVTLTLTPTLTAYTHGMVICIHNTTAINAGATINVDGLGAKAIYKYAGGSAVAVEANDMKALYHHILVYDSDAGVFLLVNPVNGTLTSTMQTEVQNFFSATDITGAEAETLTSGPTSDATLLHTHDFSGSPFEFNFLITLNAGASSNAAANAALGWSDTNDALTLVVSDTGTTDTTYFYRLLDANLVGVQPYIATSNSNAGSGLNLTTAANNGGVFISTDYWHSNGTATNIYKNGSAVTFSGTARYGKLAHDPTNSYLLVLYSTTKIARFTGISGTTITNANSDITLDTAISQSWNILYDDANSRYIGVDTVNSVIRRFNSSGTTVDTVPFVNVLGSNEIGGICIFQNRVFIVATQVFTLMQNTGTGSDTAGHIRLRFYPTAMYRS